MRGFILTFFFLKSPPPLPYRIQYSSIFKILFIISQPRMKQLSIYFVIHRTDLIPFLNKLSQFNSKNQDYPRRMRRLYGFFTAYHFFSPHFPATVNLFCSLPNHSTTIFTAAKTQLNLGIVLFKSFRSFLQSYPLWVMRLC